MGDIVKTVRGETYIKCIKIRILLETVLISELMPRKPYVLYGSPSLRNADGTHLIVLRKNNEKNKLKISKPHLLIAASLSHSELRFYRNVLTNRNTAETLSFQSRRFPIKSPRIRGEPPATFIYVLVCAALCSSRSDERYSLRYGLQRSDDIHLNLNVPSQTETTVPMIFKPKL